MRCVLRNMGKLSIFEKCCVEAIQQWKAARISSLSMWVWKQPILFYDKYFLVRQQFDALEFTTSHCAPHGERVSNKNKIYYKHLITSSRSILSFIKDTIFYLFNHIRRVRCIKFLHMFGKCEFARHHCVLCCSIENDRTSHSLQPYSQHA